MNVGIMDIVCMSLPLSPSLLNLAGGASSGGSVGPWGAWFLGCRLPVSYTGQSTQECSHVFVNERALVLSMS